MSKGNLDHNHLPILIHPGKEIPADLIPFETMVFHGFVAEILSPPVLDELRENISKMGSDWRYFEDEVKLKMLRDCQIILFTDFFPLPDCRKTFSRVRFAADFDSMNWTISFSENFLRDYNFNQAFHAWLHESYHALLHFLSLRFNNLIAADVLKPPPKIAALARRYPLPKDDSLPSKFARKNLMGMLDRSLGAIGLDSYYLNVEIMVETLTETTFKKILPNAHFKRSYTTAEKYIQNRLNGKAPVYSY